MAWEASGESDGGEEGEGFIVDEAEEEDVYQARRRRRRALIQSSSESDEEDDKQQNGKRSRKRRAYIADSSETSEVENIELGTPAGPSEKDQIADRTSSSAQSEESCTDVGSDIEGSIKNESQESKLDKDKPVPSHLKWKEGLAQKAEEAYKRRLSVTTNLHKLIYSSQPLGRDIESESDSEETANLPEVGGMFRVAEKQRTSLFHEEDSSLVSRSTPRTPQRDWAEPDNVLLVKGLFVTGSWGADDAEALLAEDDDLYGDFEDLETGDTHVEGTKEREDEKAVVNEEQAEKKRSEKKKKQKARFDSHYDDAEGEGGSYLDDLKREVSEQEKRNRAEFESMDEATRQMYEGVRPGSYVRLEFTSETIIFSA